MSQSCDPHRNAQLRAAKEILDACKLNWEARAGGSHIKIYVDAILLLVVSRGPGHVGRRQTINMRKTIERYAKGQKCRK